MNDTPEDRAPVSSAEAGGRHVDDHRGLVATALVLIAGAATAAGAFGWNRESALIVAVALTLGLSGLTAALTLDAISIRRKQRKLRENPQLIPPQEPAEDLSAETSPAGDGSEEPVEDPVADVRDSVGMHPVFLGIPAGVLLFLSLFQLWSSFVRTEIPLPAQLGTAAAVVSLLAACLWIVLAKSFLAVPESDLPESPALGQGFREAQWACLLGFGALMADQGIAGASLWVARVLLLWTAVASTEQLVRAGKLWFTQIDLQMPFVSPLELLLREAFLIRGNPVGSLFDTLEKRYGVSLRSSWALSFLRQSVWPVAALFLLFSWGLSCAAIVEPNQMALRESLGRVDKQPLGPGLHWQLPWPFGRILRYPVKTISTMQIGFQDDEMGPSTVPGKPRALLWTRAHQQEFGLVLGPGTEMVAINAIVYYKIHEDAPRLLDYAFRSDNPAAKLDAYSYRCLMELTRTTKLEDVLSVNRAEFSHQLEQRLRDYAEKERLGLDVVTVALLNVHPPVETAPNYLDVISARLDANRFELEATGTKLSQLQKSESERDGLIATARVDAARRTGIAVQESSQFVAVGKAFAVAPENFRLRLWLESLEEVLGRKALFLFDSSLLGKSGEVLLDLRPQIHSQTPESLPPSGSK